MWLASVRFSRMPPEARLAVWSSFGHANHPQIPTQFRSFSASIKSAKTCRSIFQHKPTGVGGGAVSKCHLKTWTAGGLRLPSEMSHFGFTNPPPQFLDHEHCCA